ncbi:nitroreductase family protein [Salirhabdus sp. Marseille-P4669]|uniref:nitroreductase family protein n=1 Tax=Salirhabdus sp. Marseille-P4669 TaxID=2042310 RepID=UPI000C7D27A1|nr:nitroreductase [Salirhabdus sp. Marseille-P4669]
MDIFEAIHSRRSIGKVKQDPVEKEKIHKILEAGTRAPSHYKTEPWKFFVLTEEGRRPLGRTLAEIAAEKMDDPTTEENQLLLQGQEMKAFRAPVIIAAAVVPSEHPKALPVEEIGAVNSAIQNMLLAAHALGLGAIWRTGAPCYHPKMKNLFGLEGDAQILGFLYLGYPNTTKEESPRIPFEEKTEWWSEDFE